MKLSTIQSRLSNLQKRAKEQGHLELELQILTAMTNLEVMSADNERTEAEFEYRNKQR